MFIDLWQLNKRWIESVQPRASYHSFGGRSGIDGHWFVKIEIRDEINFNFSVSRQFPLIKHERKQ